MLPSIMAACCSAIANVHYDGQIHQMNSVDVGSVIIWDRGTLAVTAIDTGVDGTKTANVKTPSGATGIAVFRGGALSVTLSYTVDASRRWGLSGHLRNNHKPPAPDTQKLIFGT